MSNLWGFTQSVMNALNKMVVEEGYQLWYLANGKLLVKIPINSLEEAEEICRTLRPDNVSGVRVAKHSEVEGCEVVLGKFDLASYE